VTTEMLTKVNNGSDTVFYKITQCCEQKHVKMCHTIYFSITQACEDFAATIIIGEMGYTKCRDSKNVNGFYV
jgi:hypothetical protein